MNDNVERFSNRVANYVKFRPDYPREIISYLESNCGLTHESLIADIGCGTGISSQLFLENCNTVTGVEPNAAMRQAAQDFLADFPGFRIVDGTSEHTTLPDASLDFVVAAQAFHWFDPEKTRPEFHRILKTRGHIVLIWNERHVNTTPFHVEYEAFLLRHAKDYTKVRHDNIAAENFEGFFQKEYRSVTFQNSQILDFDGLKGRMLSSSHMPDETNERFEEMIKELRIIFAKHAENGRIKLLYDTNVYICQI